PHYTVGVSEVHFIFGTTLYLIFGAGSAAIGLALGLLFQGVVFSPSDLPQYAINVTTLIIPLWLTTKLAKKSVAPETPYAGLKLLQVFILAACFQVGIITCVALWSRLWRRKRLCNQPVRPQLFDCHRH
ncbi:MAG: energy-coupling factor ABC transporter permease, partial [Sphingomonadales bacterium]